MLKNDFELRALEEELLDLIVVEGQDSPASEKHRAAVDAPEGATIKDILMLLLAHMAKEEHASAQARPAGAQAADEGTGNKA